MRSGCRRHLPKPKNYGDQLGRRQRIRMAERWVLCHEHVWMSGFRSVVGRFERLPRTCTPALLEQLEEAGARLKEVQGSIGERQAVLPDLLEKVRSGS